MNRYKLPISRAETSFIEKKSRFISNITPISSEEQAIAFIDEIRSKYKDASHNVFAYRIKSNNVTRFNDDGEPSGTAGMPLLDVFVKQDIYDFCAVATRYYGGIMLGAGGLVRAYSRCGSIGLDASGIGIMQKLAKCLVAVPYSLFEVVRREIIASGAKISEEDFGADIVLSIILPYEDTQTLKLRLSELSAGSVEPDIEEIVMGVF